MNKIELFRLGTNFQYLRFAANENYPVKGDLESRHIYGALSDFISILEDLKISPNIIKLLKDRYAKLDKYKEKEKISLKDGEDLFELLNRVRLQIESDLQKLISFDVIDDCTIDKTCLFNLMNGVDNPLFEKKVWKNLTSYAKNDFQDAAKCLLIGASTPATMIMLRATEEVVRQYYKSKTGKNATEEVWGTLTDELEKIPNINKDLISHLDYIRKTRRNLAQHPGEIFSQREAERIFMEVVSTVHEIYKDI